MKGRKRHIVVDTLGLVVDMVIHEANIQDRAGGVQLLDRLRIHRPTVRHMWGDSGYTGTFVREARRQGFTIEIVKRSDLAASRGVWHDPQLPLPKITRPRFMLMKRRWVVERTFAWTGRYRRLSKDYEQRVAVSGYVFWAAACRMLCQRVAHCDLSNTL